MLPHMVSKSSKAFNSWRKRMGYTYRDTANVLGVCMACVGYYTVGVRKEKNNEESKPVEVPKTVLLACSAIENDLKPIQ